MSCTGYVHAAVKLDKRIEFLEWYFSNFRSLTCFSVMIPDAV